MTIQIRKSNPHFNAYYYDNGLLIQFILIEAISTNQLTERIRSLSHQSFESIEFSETLDPLLQSLSYSLMTLIGSSECENLTMNWVKGPLSKLKLYCLQFSQNSRENKMYLRLYKYIHQAWTSALHSADVLNTILATTTSPTKKDILKIKRTIYHFYNRLHYVFKYLLRIIESFWDNENVVFFLIRKREQLSAIYGPDFIYKIFKNQTKKHRVLNLLTRRYEKRGFSHLVSALQS